MLFGLICLQSAPLFSADEDKEKDKDKTTEASAANKTPLQLSKFEITTTQDRGFNYNNSAGAFRTNQPLLDIPQVDVVVTRDMLDAIRFTDSSQILKYVGMVPSYEGEEQISRGVGMLPFQDDVPMGGVPYADAGVIDNYEVIKGAAQVLYLSNSLAGLVVKNTKKPLSYRREEVQLSVDSLGSLRAMVDATGPLGTIGGAKVSYRFIGIHRDDGEYYVNLDHKADIIMPQIQVDFPNTSIRAYYQRSNLVRSPNQSALLQPNGEVSIPPTGREHADRLTQNSMEMHDSNLGYISIDTKLSDNWNNRFKGAFRHSRRLGSNPLALYANWDTRQVGYITRKLDLPSSAEVIMDDLQGNYDIGPTSHIDAMGFIKATTTFWNSIWGAPTLPDDSVWKNVVWLPIDDTQNQIESAKYAAPKLSDYDGSKVANAQSRQATDTTLVYYAHSANITKYLTLTAGVSWAQQKVTGITNTRVRPLVATVPTIQSEKLHRFGVVFKPLKDVSIYALESSTFNAASGGGQVLADGTFPPNPIGKNREIGIKTALLDGKITTNLSFFEMTITGNVKLGGIRDDGSIYYVPVPGNSEQSKGFDGNIALTLVPGLQVLATYSNVDRALYTKQPQQTWSVFADYRFAKGGPLSGLSIGGGTSHVYGTYVPLSGTYTYSGQTDWEKATGLKELKDSGTPVKVYAAYQYNKHWRFNLSIDNLFDEVYAFGGIGGLHTVLDMGMPRTITLESTYRF